MSKPSTPSTSSTDTTDSWEDLTRLGEYILDQLGRDERSRNLLVHWVAHRLAEHMTAAESSTDPREQAAEQDAAALLITRLWRARGGWPEGWPPNAVQDFTEGVQSARARRPDRSRPLPPWLSTLAELRSLQAQEAAAWVNAALLEVGAADIQRALEAAGDDGESDDIARLRWQRGRHEDAEAWFSEHASEGEDATRRNDRALIIERVLEDMVAKRADLTQRTLKDARRGQRRKPA